MSKSTDLALLSTYRSKRNVRLRVGRIVHEIKEEWLVAAIIAANLIPN